MEQRYYNGQESFSQSDNRSRISRLFGRDRGGQPMPTAPYQPVQGGYQPSPTGYQPSYQPAQGVGYQPSAGYQGAGSQGGVVIYSPKTYQDVQLLIDHLKAREQIIVDFSSVNKTSVYRILDFMSGAIYALGGSIQQITTNIFLFAPQGVTITLPPQFGRK